METGDLSQSVLARASIQAASPHWYLAMSHTTEADFGGVSQQKA